MAKYDFMSFGEPNIRMTPPNHDRLGQSDTLQLGIAAQSSTAASTSPT